MYLNLHTVIYNVDDLPKAKEWYSKIFSADPVVDQPSFVSFSVGSDRLGLSRVDKPMVCNDTFPVAYWVGSDI
ncbi:hypothetical protein [Desulfospira joergensenii]|uniref:hypothetical protein n=1 Tax=Desulfospira joergensenii TaxID=53329 RepID=UPI000683F26C|nr:hypothetical protein [Desulfospira joergensenii]